MYRKTTRKNIYRRSYFRRSIWFYFGFVSGLEILAGFLLLLAVVGIGVCMYVCQARQAGGWGAFGWAPAPGGGGRGGQAQVVYGMIRARTENCDRSLLLAVGIGVGMVLCFIY